MKKTTKALLLAAMTVTALAGCSSKPADPAATATEAVTTTAAADTTAAEAADTTAAKDASAEDGKSYTIGIGQFAEHGMKMHRQTAEQPARSSTTLFPKRQI